MANDPTEVNISTIEHKVVIESEFDQQTVTISLPEAIEVVEVGHQGPQGIQGVQGVQGVPGQDGVDGTGDLHYTHTQSLASAVWTVTHNLGKKPAVTVVDSGDNVQVGHVEYLDLNSLRITHSAAFGGKAYCN